MPVSRGFTFIEAVSLCVCVVNAIKTDATFQQVDSPHQHVTSRATVTNYVVLPWGAVQLPPLNSTYQNLRSGPILILDTSTLYITSIRYDGRLPDLHFQAYNYTINLSVTLFDDNNSTNELHAHWGDNVYLRLPDSIAIYDIEYINLWSQNTQKIYANMAIPSNIKVPENAETIEDQNGIKLIRLPKCCNIEEAYGDEGCNKSTQQFSPQTNFFEMNSTHINNESLSYDCAKYLPYVSTLECKYGKIALYPDTDEYLFLQNGSLLYLDERILLSQDQYCMETIEEMQETVPFICLKPRGYPEIIYYIYASGMLLSCVFFISTAAIFYFVFEDCKIRIRCVILYSFCMAGSFATLSSAQLFHVEGATCNALGYILEFFFILSFTWLALLSYETHYIIRFPPSKRYKNRFKIYCGLSVTVALVLVLLTAVISEIPFLPQQILKPQFGHNSCVFDERSLKTLFFYLPIFIGIFISIGYLIYARYLIYRKDNIPNDLKSKFRACWILVTIATLCWLMEVLSFALNSQSGLIVAMDIVECLQGLFVFIIFVLHNPVKEKLTSKLCPSKSNSQNGNAMNDSFLDRLSEMNELRPLQIQNSEIPQNTF